MRRLQAVLALLLVAAPVFGQTTRPIQLDIDHASFAYDESNSMLELYLAFEAETLPFIGSETGFRADVPLQLAVLRATDANLPGTPAGSVWQDSLQLSFVIADTSGLRQGQQFVHQVRTAVVPGEYELRIVLPPVKDGDQELMLRRDLVIPNFSDAELIELSDLTLASEIKRGQDREDPFYKNGLVIRPNANQLFGSGLNRVFYYGEAYNLTQLAGSADEYTVFSYIAEANLPQPLPDLQRRSARPLRSPDVLVGYFDISKLPSGSYFLRLAVLNAENEAIVERARKFFVYNPQVERVATNMGMEQAFETSQYAIMTEEEIEQSRKHIEIIANANERRRFGNIKDLDERRRFLMEFWNVRDPNPNTAINEFKEDFYKRLQFANDRYTSRFSEGWETDRGRTMIKFGTPTTVEPHLFDRGVTPYELWEYNNIAGEGQAQFIFADRDGFGMFELIHSTVAGERKLANWRQELQQ